MSIRSKITDIRKGFQYASFSRMSRILKTEKAIKIQFVVVYQFLFKRAQIEIPCNSCSELDGDHKEHQVNNEADIYCNSLNYLKMN